MPTATFLFGAIYLNINFQTAVNSDFCFRFFVIAARYTRNVVTIAFVPCRNLIPLDLTIRHRTDSAHIANCLLRSYRFTFGYRKKLMTIQMLRSYIINLNEVM
jgi:hypothetical protein